MSDNKSSSRQNVEQLESGQRSYLVGLPVSVTVYDDGTVTYAVDTADAGYAVAREADGTDADVAAIDADHKRRWQHQRAAEQTVRAHGSTVDVLMERLSERGVESSWTSTGGGCYAVAVDMADGGEVLVTDARDVFSYRDADSDADRTGWFAGRYSSEHGDMLREVYCSPVGDPTYAGPASDVDDVASAIVLEALRTLSPVEYHDAERARTWRWRPFRDADGTVSALFAVAYHPTEHVEETDVCVAVGTAMPQTVENLQHAAAAFGAMYETDVVGVPRGAVTYEAWCRECGATFNPAHDDIDDSGMAEHHECGGRGVVLGWWH